MMTKLSHESMMRKKQLREKHQQVPGGGGLSVVGRQMGRKEVGGLLKVDFSVKLP